MLSNLSYLLNQIYIKSRIEMIVSAGFVLSEISKEEADRVKAQQDYIKENSHYHRD